MGHLDAEPRIKMEVSESEQGRTIKAEIPGVKKENVKVAVEGNQVTIATETKRETEEKDGETVVRRESYIGHRSRSFPLAHEIDDTKAVAKYRDGILEVRLPKKPSSGGRKVLPIS